MKSGFLEEWMLNQRYNKEYIDKEMEIDNDFIYGNEAIYSVLKDNDNVYFLDFNSLLSSDEGYIKYSKTNLPLYYNSNHLTAYGAEWLYEKVKYEEIYEWVINLVEN
jgi:hypothetical protein